MSQGEQTPAPLRAGVVGLGWAGRKHLLAYSQIPGVEIVAAAGMEADAARELSEKYSLQRTYTDASAMIASEDLDIISIGTPTALHAPMAIEALNAGLHVIVEKPMADSADAARAMVRAARENDRVLEVVFNKRRRAVVKAVDQATRQGVLGRVYYAKAGWVRRRGIPGLGSWFTRRSLAGGGPMMDIGVHALDMALSVLGEPRAISVTGATYAEFGPRGLGHSTAIARQNLGSDAYEVEDLGSAFMRMSDGSTLLLEASWAQFVPEDMLYLTLFGTEGGAQVQTEIPGGEQVLRISTDVNGMLADVHPALPAEGIHGDCVVDFVRHVREGDWSKHDGSEGLARSVIIDAIYRSAAERREIVLTEDDYLN